jgi:hypothetical protein
MRRAPRRDESPRLKAVAWAEYLQALRSVALKFGSLCAGIRIRAEWGGMENSYNLRVINKKRVFFLTLLRNFYGCSESNVLSELQYV